MAKPVILPSRTFPTRAAAKKFFRTLHNDKYRVGEVVTDAVDDQLLRELVEHHPRAAEKVGPGIAEFYIDYTTSGDRSFVRPDYTGIWIRDVEGDTRDFSYNIAIDEPTDQAVAREALRNEVEDLRVSFREDAMRTPRKCPRSGTVMRRWEEAAVVYESPSWSALTQSFAVAVGGWDKLETDSGDGGIKIGRTLRDRSLARQWRTHWQKFANPIVVSKSAV